MQCPSLARARREFRSEQCGEPPRRRDLRPGRGSAYPALMLSRSIRTKVLRKLVCALDPACVAVRLVGKHVLGIFAAESGCDVSCKCHRSLPFALKEIAPPGRPYWPHLRICRLPAAPHPATPIGVVVRQPGCRVCRTLPCPTFFKCANQSLARVPTSTNGRFSRLSSTPSTTTNIPFSIHFFRIVEILAL